jgi:hypothetical protein
MGRLKITEACLVANNPGAASWWPRQTQLGSHGRRGGQGDIRAGRDYASNAFGARDGEHRAKVTRVGAISTVGKGVAGIVRPVVGRDNAVAQTVCGFNRLQLVKRRGKDEQCFSIDAAH